MASSRHIGRRRLANDEEKILTNITIALCAVAALETNGRHLRHTSILTSHDYMLEVLNGPDDRIFDKCRMEKDCFTNLCYILAQQGKLRSNRRMSIEEQVMIFLIIVGKNETIRMMMEDFQHSGETISRYVGEVCEAICELKTGFIRPPDFSDVSLEISTNRKYYPFFKDCIGAIDGKHVYASVPLEFGDRYQNRKGTLS
ncbi:uncharacterized protein LOC116144141 [Pistacia vera]|uniref:uncharacterized protein LOC116144141 n=1 Tax=Pistacia vera TaxID=55513 RepID=UPI001262E7AE|nr:uncharacterized protein LOC116144141 [Pistacia vera]